MKSDFRFGIIGCGNIASHFVQAAHSLPGVRIVAAAARDITRSQAFAARHNIEYAYGDYAAMLRKCELDGVYIATVNTAHLEPMLLALNAGIPVLCEKPITLTIEDFDRAADAAQKNNTLLMEAMWSCFLPSYQAMRELLQCNTLGRVSTAYLHFCVPFPKDPNSRIYSPALGGGLIYDIGVYNLHTAFSLFGDDYKNLSVSGCLGPTGVDISSVISFTYPQGPTVCTTTADVCGPHELLICGEKGQLYADGYNGAQRLTLQPIERPEQILSYPFACNGFEYEIQEFVSLVEAGCRESAVLPLSRSRKICAIMESAVQQIKSSEVK